MRILLVEDEPDAARALAKGLREQAYAVDVVGDGEAACYQASIADYDAIVLDVLLPLKDGLSVCRQLRQEGAAVPILMLTARDSVEARIAGLDSGADDYLTKPFAFGELLARLRALIRRGNRAPLPELLQVAGLELDTRAHRVRKRGREVPLTAREYALLEYLARRAGEVVGRAEIAEHVWDENYDPFSNLIEVYVRRLRRKLDDPGSESLILHAQGRRVRADPVPGRPPMSLSIRARLTLWYAAVLSLVLAASAIAFYVVQWRLRLVQLDEELTSAEALVGRLMPLELDEGLDLAMAAGGALEDIAEPGRPLAVFDAAGALLSGNWDGLPSPGALESGTPEAPATLKTPAGAFRVLWTRHRHNRIPYQIGAARSLAPVEQELLALRRALVSGALFALLLAAGGGWWIARGALRPVTVMAAQAGRITERTPGQRLTAASPEDELGRLARAFNELLARLEAALSTQRRFMADAAHELRTPVSVARTAAEVALGRPSRPEHEYRDALGIVANQMRRLARIVEDMLLLARADAAGMPAQIAPLYLDELVADCVKEAKLLAMAKRIRVDWQGDSDLEADGDERLLRQMLVNLLDNAVRHTPAGGWVHLDLQARPKAFEVAVTDSGAGIPEAQHERIFERFVRLDEARGPSQGAGLGLSIARAIAEAHGGSLVLSRSDASGSTFLARLPRNERTPRQPEASPTSTGE